MNWNCKKYALIKKYEVLDYKDVDVLGRFINEQGKILPKRSTGLTSKQQKMLTKSIKRARILSLVGCLNRE